MNEGVPSLSELQERSPTPELVKADTDDSAKSSRVDRWEESLIKNVRPLFHIYLT